MTATDDPSASVVLEWPLPEVARITLNRGSELNTLTFAMVEALDDAVEAASSGGARVVILTGSGRAFCGGAYVKYFTDPNSPLYCNPAEIRDRYVRDILHVFRKLQDRPFVTIAAINGFALGGGCELALSCDFRLIATEARIGLTEARLGAIPGAGGLQHLAKIVGRAKALEIILLGDQWSAEDARAAGLVTAIHPSEELADAALAMAGRLLQCSPTTIAESKRAIYRCEVASSTEADEIALDAVAFCAAGRDWKEGMAAFAERRQPDFARSGLKPA